MGRKSMSTETEQGTKGGRGRSVALGKVNLLLAILGLLFLAGAYWINFLPEALALLVLAVSPVTVVCGCGTLAGEDSSTGSFVIPSVANCGPICCSVSTSGCSGRCSVPPSWRARSRSSRPESGRSSRCRYRTGSRTNRS